MQNDNDQVIQLANQLMAEHGLVGWRVILDSARRRNACCKYDIKTITVSYSFVLLNSEEQVRETLLHEIAHALVGPGHGHNSVWVAKAREIGSLGLRCFNNEIREDSLGVVVKAPMPYQATCPGCDRISQRSRAVRPGRQYSCPRCSNRFDTRFLLTYKRVY